MPIFAEFLFSKFGFIKVHGTVYFVQIGTYRLAVFVRQKYVKLIFDLRKNHIYRITKSHEVIVTSYQNILNSTTFEVGTDARIEACELVFGDLSDESILLALHIFSLSRVHAFRHDFVILERFKRDSVEKIIG